MVDFRAFSWKQSTVGAGNRVVLGPDNKNKELKEAKLLDCAEKNVKVGWKWMKKIPVASSYFSLHENLLDKRSFKVG